MIWRCMGAWCVLLLGLAVCVSAQPASRPAMLVGTLQSRVDRIEQVRRAGVTLATVSVAWDRFQPAPDRFDPAYVDGLRAEIAAFRKAGQLVQLDLGVQYPPDWVRGLPDARFVNQYGQEYVDKRPGANVVNAVFNAAVRERVAGYVEAVLDELGDDVYAVRIGFGYYGELGYPAGKFGERSNCYWAFDRLVQGHVEGLPADNKPCPVRGWKPGEASDSHRSARAFAEWYLDSLAAYQRWQIATVRRYHKGRIVVLLGSWGLRPGMLEKAIARDLGGDGQAELSLGYDFQRLAGAIDDPNVALCTTWIDANPAYGDDPPVKVLAELAKARKLELWAENTGNADAAAMKLSFERARQYGVSALVWAFEPQLFDGQHATLADLAAAAKH